MSGCFHSSVREAQAVLGPGGPKGKWKYGAVNEHEFRRSESPKASLSESRQHSCFYRICIFEWSRGILGRILCLDLQRPKSGQQWRDTHLLLRGYRNGALRPFGSMRDKEKGNPLRHHFFHVEHRVHDDHVCHCIICLCTLLTPQPFEDVPLFLGELPEE